METLHDNKKQARDHVYMYFCVTKRKYTCLYLYKNTMKGYIIISSYYMLVCVGGWSKWRMGENELFTFLIFEYFLFWIVYYLLKKKKKFKKMYMTHGPEISLLKIYTTDKFAHVNTDRQNEGIYCSSVLSSETKTNLDVIGSWLNNFKTRKKGKRANIRMEISRRIPETGNNVWIWGGKPEVGHREETFHCMLFKSA